MTDHTHLSLARMSRPSADVSSSGGERTLRATLYALTMVTGPVDAVSFLALGHVFTANMTGNVVFLAFALAGVPSLSVPRSLSSLCAFLAGAVLGGQLGTRMVGGPQNRWISTAVVPSAETNSS